MIIFDNAVCEGKEGYENDFGNLLKNIKSNYPSITGLDIRGDLTPEQFASLFQALGVNTKVVNLILRGQSFKCDLSNEVIHSELAVLLVNNQNIKSLTLYFTNIEDIGMKSLCTALENNTTLKYFKICGDKIGLAGELALVKMLVQNTTLEELDFKEGLSEGAMIALLSSSEKMIPRKLELHPTFSKSCANIWPKEPDNLQNFLECYASFKPKTMEENSTYIDFLKSQIMNIFFKNKNPITNHFKEKTKLLDELIRTLKSEKFSTNFIESVKNFNNTKFLSKNKTFENKYSELVKEKNKKFKEIHELEVSNQVKMDKIDELINYYFEKRLEIINEYNNFQNLILKALNSKVWEISTIERAVVKQLPKDKTIQDEPVKLSAKNLIPVVDDLELKIITPVVKRLDINNQIYPQKYFFEWTKQVSVRDYEFVIISIGSHNSIKQQIPGFCQEMGKAGQVAILNIDKVFNFEEMKNQSDSDTISVNYLEGKIQTAGRFCFTLPDSNLEFQANPEHFNLLQDDLVHNIQTLTNSGKKVILVNHTAPAGSRIMLEKVLKNNDIMENYGSKFLFINSYFDQEPAILCTKKFVEFMMDPMNLYQKHEEHTYDIAEVQKADGVYNNFLGKIYFKGMLPTVAEPTFEEMYGSKIFDTLSDINEVDVIKSLMGYQNNYFENAY